jgi:hypothetical protein
MDPMEMKIKQYQDAIDILMSLSGQPDKLEELVTKLAKMRPDVLIEVYSGVVGWEKEIREMMESKTSGGKIRAIKRYREMFGVGLKDAKIAVDKIQQSIRFSRI